VVGEQIRSTSHTIGNTQE